MRHTPARGVFEVHLKIDTKESLCTSLSRKGQTLPAVVRNKN